MYCILLPSRAPPQASSLPRLSVPVSVYASVSPPFALLRHAISGPYRPSPPTGPSLRTRPDPGWIHRRAPPIQPRVLPREHDCSVDRNGETAVASSEHDEDHLCASATSYSATPRRCFGVLLLVLIVLIGVFVTRMNPRASFAFDRPSSPGHAPVSLAIPPSLLRLRPSVSRPLTFHRSRVLPLQSCRDGRSFSLRAGDAR